MAKKTIYLTDSNHSRLRDALIQKLETHPDSSKIGKSDKLGYESLAEFIQKSLTPILEDSKYARYKTLEVHVSYHCLWTIIYETKRRPKSRKRMNRTAIELLILFTFGEISDEMLEEGTEDLQDDQPSESVAQEGNDLQEFAYYEEFSFRKLQRAIKTAKTEIKILDTFLDNWGKLKKYLEAATERNCKVRLVVSDPSLPCIVERSRNISVFMGNKTSLHASIENIRAEIATWERADLVELRVHDCLPSFNLFAVDESYFIGLFWHDKEAVEGPFMKVKRASFKAYVDEHFESIWKYAATRKESQLLNISVSSGTHLKKYVGNWYMYCNQVGKNEETYKLRFMEHGKVVENLLQIKEEGGELSAIFVSKARGIFKGDVYPCPTNESFVEMRLYSSETKGTLHFVFHIGKGLDDYLIGIYNHMYVNAPILGTGLAAMVKSDIQEEMKPEDWEGRDITKIENEEVNKIIRYLTFPSGVRIEATQSFEHLKTFKRFNLPSLFKGVYKIYSYQGSESNNYSRYISESLLKIDDKHQAFHKRYNSTFAQSGKMAISIGKVQASKEDSLIISLKSKANGRIGFFVINIGDYTPRAKHYYTGIFTGVALQNRRVAIGNRVVLEYMGEDYGLFETTSINRFGIQEAEIDKVPLEVRDNLMGRVNNMVGFLKTEGASSKKALEKEANTGIDMKQVFFDSACQRALTDDVNEVANAAKMFERAILHGFRPFSAFEEKLADYESNGLISARIMNAILGNKIYLGIEKAIRG